MAVNPKRKDQIGSLIREVESLARDVRAGLRKQAQTLPRDLQKVADRMRLRAAAAAGQVERYVHEIRVELEGSKKKSPAKKAARPARKRRG